MRGFWRLRFGQRPRSRVIDLPLGKEPTTPDPEPRAPAPRKDWPRIISTHPNWWQVHRVEVCGLEKNYVLIAEVRTETEAFKVAAGQTSQVRIRKWGSKARDYLSPHEPLLVVTGTVSQADE